MSNLYIDLLITPDGDFTLDSGNEPLSCNNRISIGQDIRHAIIESGLCTKLVAERSPTLRADVMTQLELLVEDDVRIVPGTVMITDEEPTRISITAQTYDFGSINTEVELTNDRPSAASGLQTSINR